MNAFTGQNLAEKLSKLNSSQQSIETLSHWCIFHRKKARQVVETWEREFYDAPREQRLPFLYLSNDILQNGKKKGTEFVTEFWKVLPGALRDVIENSEEAARNAAFRLIDIWEERKVFGSRPHSLRDELLGSKAVQSSAKSLDAPSTPSKPRLFAGGYLDKVAAALQVVQDGSKDEEAILVKCHNAMNDVDSLEKEAQFISTNGEGDETVILEELEKQQIILSQCVEQLESYEKSRDVLVQQLKEILHEQERKLESIRQSVQIAQAQAEQAGSIRHRMITGSPIGVPVVSPLRENGSGDDLHSGSAILNQHHENMTTHDEGGSSDISQGLSNVSLPPAASPRRMLERTPSLDVEGKQVHQNPAAPTAAEMAARLTADSSSVAMLTSVLTSLAAQESTALGHSSPENQRQFHDALLSGGHHLDKRQRLDNNISMGEAVGHSPTDGIGQTGGSYLQHQQNPNSQSLSGHQHSSGGVQQQQSGPPPPPSSQHQQQLHKQIPGPPPLPQYLQGGQGQVQLIPPGPPPPSQFSYSGGPGMSVIQGPPHPLMQSVTGGPRMQQAPLPPGLNPPNSLQPLQPPGLVGFYTQPPLPAPPAPVPRQ